MVVRGKTVANCTKMHIGVPTDGRDWSQMLYSNAVPIDLGTHARTCAELTSV